LPSPEKLKEGIFGHKQFKKGEILKNEKLKKAKL